MPKAEQKKLKKPSLIIPSQDNVTVLSPEEQAALGMDISSMVTEEQLDLLNDYASSGKDKSVVIIRPDNSLPETTSPSMPPARISMLNQSGTSSQFLISIPEASANQGDIAQAEIMISLPENPSRKSSAPGKSSSRGRPNKYVVLDNGDIVKQVLPKKAVVEKKISKTIEEPEAEKSPPAARKRGRPRKKQQSDSEEEDDPLKSESGGEKWPESKRRTARKSAGRNKKYEDFEEVEDGNDSAYPDLPGVTIEKLDATPPKRRRGRPSRNSRSENHKEEEAEEIFEKPKKLRKKSDAPSHSRNKFDENNLNLSAVDCADVVTCGDCNTEMPRKKYEIHRIVTHHGLTWIVGENDPINFYDSSSTNLNFLGACIREAFNAIGKVNASSKKTMLACLKCEKPIFSYMGYLSHITFCGLTAEESDKRMYQCPVCDRKVFPASRYYHDNSHNQAEAEVEPLEFVDVGQPPRRAAALKARSFIKDFDDEGVVDNAPSIEFKVIDVENRKGLSGKRKGWSKEIASSGNATCKYLGCTFKTPDAKAFEDHVTVSCPYRKKLYVCAQCECKFSSEAEVMVHFKTNHASAVEVGNDAEDDMSEEELFAVEYISEKSRRKSSKAPPPKISSPSKDDVGLNITIPSSLRCLQYQKQVRNKVPYRSTLYWMLDFCKQNFSPEILFPKIFDVPDFEVLQQPELYLPLTEKSILFAAAKTVKPRINLAFSSSAQWQSLPRLLGSCINGVPTLFAGGPILAMAWCPTTTNYTPQEQLLAVSCHKSMDSKLGFQGILPQNSFLQIWSFGPLTNATLAPPAPELKIGLGHKWGIVRHLEWCPSGSYEPASGKFGILAAACADGTVRIVPVCSKQAENKHLRAEASRTLIPHSNKERLNQCISLNWHLGKGHKVIAAGFADGLLCFWNLAVESTLLKTSDDKTLPYLHFYAHQGPVTAVKIYPHCDAKYVATGGITDKLLNFWNLEERGEAPISHSNKKAKITRIAWPTCWPCVIASYEEQSTTTLAIPPRNFMHHNNILPHNSSASDIGISDWLNCVAHSTGAGEVSLIINNQMMFGMDTDKSIKERRALLTRTSISEHLLTEKEDGSVEGVDPPDLYFANYDEVSKRGIVFCDVTLDTDKAWPAASDVAQSADKMESCCSANYPVTSVNRLAWNPNVTSFGWIAVGYQCGLVRVLKIKAETSDAILSR